MSNWEASVAFSIQQQLQDQWCWAAVAVSVSRFYDPNRSPWSQCSLAQEVLQISGCCPKNAACNKPAALDAALSSTQNLNAPVSGTIPVDQIVQELQAGRPVAAGVDFDGTDHFVVISAASTSPATLQICDPEHGTIAPCGYDDFCNKYLGSWSWVSTYYTQTFANVAQDSIAHAMPPTAVASTFDNFTAKPRRSPKKRRARAPSKGDRQSVSQIYAMRLADLANDFNLDKAVSVGWQQLSQSSDGPYAIDVYDVDGAFRDATITSGPQVGDTLQRISDTRSRLRADHTLRESRLLRMPSIHVVVLWLKSADDASDIIVPLHPARNPLEPGKLYGVGEIKPILEALGKAQIQANVATRKRTATTLRSEVS